MIKNMLENGQEEVPAHIWDKVSARLGKATVATASVVATASIVKKFATSWWKYAVAGVSAAAVVTVGTVIGIRQMSKPPQQEMIAVVEQDTTATPVLIAEVQEQDIAHIVEKIIAKEHKPVKESQVIEKSEQVSHTENVVQEKAEEPSETKVAEEFTGDPVESQDLKFEDDSYFQEEEVEKSKKNKVTVSLSGLTAGNVGKSNVAEFNLAPKRSSAYQILATTGVIENSSNSQYNLPFSVALGLKLNLTKRVALGTGLNYTLLTRRYDGTYNNSEEGITIASDIRNSQHYLGVPLNVYFSFVKAKRLDCYVYAGGAVEKCVQNHYLVLKDTQYTHTKKVDGVQWSTNVGLGVEYRIIDWFGIYIDPSLRYYFDNSQPKSIRTAQPLNFGVELGLRFHI